MTKAEKLQEFGRWCLETMREDCGDIDGGWAQDKAIALGLLARVTVAEPCGPDCRCVEYHGEFPCECLQEQFDEAKP